MDRKTEKSEVCQMADNCSMLEAERELSVESLRTHLSDQRHDFFNLLQILYGYTQLKKSEKVLSHITDYCRQMENIGRLYNARCIKMADLFYTKGKEADSIDLNLEVNTDISFEPTARILEDDRVLHVVDLVLSGLYYMLDAAGCKETHIICHLKENADNFLLEMWCSEIRDGKIDGFTPVLHDLEIFWEKIERTVTDFDAIEKYCVNNGFMGKVLEAGTAFMLGISKYRNDKGNL